MSGDTALSRSCSAVCRLFQALTFGETKPGTNVTMIDARRFSAASSGRRRARCARDRSAARATECEKMIGACDTRIASSIVSGDTWLRSTSMPSQFISLTTSSPKADRPPDFGVSGTNRPTACSSMRERHVACTQTMEHAQVGERVVDRVAALHADERRDLALLVDPLDVVGGQRELEGVRDTSAPCGGRCRSARAWR